MMNNRTIKGLTLLEIMVVVIILGILAGIVFPRYTKTTAHAREAEGWMFLTTIRSSELRYYTEYNEIFAGAISKLDIDQPPSSLFTYSVSSALPPPVFTATATPAATCNLCRTLTLDNAGVRTQQ